MGIKSLSKFLRDKWPDLFELVHISEYHFKKVAIDTSLYLCNFKALYGEEGWLRAFIKLVACLRENEIHCVFIYDSGSPPEKDAEKKERAEQRAKMEERTYRLEQAIDNYHQNGIIEDVLLEFQEKRKIKHASLLRPGHVSINIGAIEYAVAKMRKQLFRITQNDFAVTKQLFDLLDVPYFDAPLEAETMCADLCKQGKVDAVLSEDTDVLAYGAPVFLTKFNTSNGGCYQIRYDRVLEELGMTPKQFLDFCIMCGTDYNKNVAGIGPAGAYKLISAHGTIEDAIKSIDKKKDTTVLNYVRCRELFKKYPRSNVKVSYCGCPDFNALQQFLFRKNLGMNVESLKKAFVHNTVVFQDDED
uniref:XPG N-terminal domain-containing protein n=1 Tax=viral metagenome TaxID=1070528 RepID=A0A6C0ELS8_9ZZZZ